jgi:hypothetical protein
MTPATLRRLPRRLDRGATAEIEMIFIMPILAMLMFLAFGVWQMISAMMFVNRTAYSDLQAHTNFNLYEHYLMEPLNTAREYEYGYDAFPFPISQKMSFEFTNGYSPPSWLAIDSMPNTIAFGSGGSKSVKVFAQTPNLRATDSKGFMPTVKFTQQYANPATPPWTWEHSPVKDFQTAGANQMLGGAGPSSLQLDKDP